MCNGSIPFLLCQVLLHRTVQRELKTLNRAIAKEPLNFSRSRFWCNLFVSRNEIKNAHWSGSEV